MARRRTRRGTRAPAREAAIRAIVLVAGVVYLTTGLLLFISPDWFFEYIGNFPPYNPHYMGDLGSFLAPLGVALIVASQDPARNRPLIAVAVAGSLIHAVNHLRDAADQPVSVWFTDTIPIMIFGIIFAAALWQIRPRR